MKSRRFLSLILAFAMVLGTLSYAPMTFAAEPCTHTYTSEVVAQATETSPGARRYTCTKCGDTYVESIPPVAGEHTWVYESTSVPASCQPGQDMYHCYHCNVSQAFATPATGCVYPASYGYTCPGCQRTFPVLYDINDEILALWNATNGGTSITDMNDFYNRMTALHETIDGLTADQKAAYNMYCSGYFYHLGVLDAQMPEEPPVQDYYEILSHASQTYNIAWDDAEDTGYRTAMNNFMGAAGVVLNINVMNGSTKVNALSGTLAFDATDNQIRNFPLYNALYGNTDPMAVMNGTPLISIAANGTDGYKLTTGDYLPLSFKHVASNGQGGTTTTNYTVNYTISLQAPNAYYTLTPTSGEIQPNGTATLTLIPQECNHNYVGTVETPATCGTAGVMKYTCDKCSDFYTEPIPATGDHHYSGEVDTPATCGDDGVMKYTCSGCGDTYTEPIPATGEHHFTGEVKVEPTCVSAGLMLYTCDGCGASYNEEILPTGEHDWFLLETQVPASCQPGTDVYGCRNCTETKTVDTEPVGHIYLPEYNYICPGCGHTFPEVEAINDEIAALWEETEHATVINNTVEFIQRMEELAEALDALTPDRTASFEINGLTEEYEKLKALVPEEPLFEISYDVVATGSKTFNTAWNDNEKTDKRTPFDEFLAASDAVLNFTVTDSEGTPIPELSGSLPFDADADTLRELPIYQLLYGTTNPDDVSGGIPLLTAEQGPGAMYRIKSGSYLVRSYDRTTYDVSSGDKVVDRFYIDYTVSFKTPNESYVITAPEEVPVDETITLNPDETAMLTILEEDWTAQIEWFDEHNLSTDLNGAAPRLSPADLLEKVTDEEENETYRYIEVYRTVEGSPDEALLLDPSLYNLTIVQNPEDPDVYDIALEGLPKYSNDQQPYHYILHLRDAEVSTEDSDRFNAKNGGGNRYAATYENYNNYSSLTDAIYNKGLAMELLFNFVPFTVTKVWEDRYPGDTANASRPSAILNVWAYLEKHNSDGSLNLNATFSDVYPIAGIRRDTNVPKQDGTVYISTTTDSTGTTYNVLLPMYNNQGLRYIYYGVENNLTGDYKAEIDNRSADSEARNHDGVISYFELNDPTHFLNGATITNKLTGIAAPAITKEFIAASLQTIESDAEEGVFGAEFTLQFKDPETGEWRNATAADVITEPGSMEGLSITDEKVVYSMTDFNPSKMTDSFSGVIAQKYINGIPVEYRWVETKIIVNGGYAELDSSRWQDGNTAHFMAYRDVIKLVEGDPQSGPGATTVCFLSQTDGSTFTNTLVGDNRIQARKFWYGYNDEHEIVDIAGDARLAGYKVLFWVLKDGEKVAEIEMSQEDLVEVENGSDFWTAFVDLPRYDENGNEFRYTLVEKGVIAPGGSLDTSWSYEENYTNDAINIGTEENPFYIKRTIASFVNGPGEGRVLWFNATKEWHDDTDLTSRAPVYATLYRFAEPDDSEQGYHYITPEIVTDFGNNGTLTLSEANNWFRRESIRANDFRNEQDEVVSSDRIDFYILLESSVKPEDFAAVGVDYNSLINNANTNSADFAAIVAAMRAGYVTIGTLGREDAVSTDGSAPWDGLYYRYLVSETIDVDGTNGAEVYYTLRNARLGKVNVVLNKQWATGADYFGGLFRLTVRNNDTGASEDLVTLRLSLENGNIVLKDTDGVVWANTDHYCYTDDIALLSASRNASTGVANAKLTINNLPKYDEEGRVLVYELREIAFLDEAGAEHQLSGGRVTIDGYVYTVSSSRSTDYPDIYQHSEPDVYNYNYSNSRTGGYSITSFKVWRDTTLTSGMRPNVRFTIYRRSTSDATLRAMVEALDTPGSTVTADDIAAYLAQKLQDGGTSLVKRDLLWDTQINDYLWTCDISGLEQFDGNGYAYVYFGIEEMSTLGSIYKAYYSNYTAESDMAAGLTYRPVPLTSGTFKTKDVYAIPTEELTDGVDNVFLLADGIHNVNGDFSKYFAATVVNMPKRTRTISGEKIWLLPLDLVVPASELPAVTVDLYRSKEIISGTGLTDMEYLAAIRAASELMATTVIGEGDSADYSYSFGRAEAKDNELLERYDNWGELYYYYAVERVTEQTHIRNFTIVTNSFSEENFNITNVFTSETPFVEITVSKTWEIDPRLEIDDLSTLDPTFLANAVIKLKGWATDRNGNKLNVNSPTEFGKVTLKPTDPTAVITRDPDTNVITSVTVSYTFTDYENKNITDRDGHPTREYLPYYGPNGQPFWYALDETVTNGYQQRQLHNEHVEFTETRIQDDLLFYVNTGDDEVASFVNTYNGDDRDPIEFVKTWNEDADNSSYRPASLVFEIRRRSDSTVQDDFVLYIPLMKTDFASNASQWKVWLNGYNLDGTLSESRATTNAQGVKRYDYNSGQYLTFLKYAPDGSEYTYYIAGEYLGDEQGNRIIDSGNGAFASEVGDEIGYYKLTEKSDTELVNTLTLSTSVSGKKTWTFDGQEMDYTRFCDLRKFGALPAKVQYIVMRSEVKSGNTYINYQYVPATDHPGSSTVVIGGTEYLGREVDITALDSMSSFRQLMNVSFRWNNLPLHPNGNPTRTNDYIVVERLIWQDGTVTENIASTTAGVHGIDVTVVRNDETKSFAFTNDINTVELTLDKIWVDQQGYDNTRPKTIRVSLVPTDDEYNPIPGAGFDFTFIPTTNGVHGSSTSVYTSQDSYYISLDAFMTGKFILTEMMEMDCSDYDAKVVVGEQGYMLTKLGVQNGYRVYTLNVDGSTMNIFTQNADDSYTINLKNTLVPRLRNNIDLEATKTWAGDDLWYTETRPEIYFALQYLEQGKPDAEANWHTITRMADFSLLTTQQTVQKVADFTSSEIGSDNLPLTKNGARWKQMFKYWAEPAVDGEPELIKYRVVELVILNGTTTMVRLTSSNTGYSTTAPVKYSINTEDNVYTLNVKNTLQKTSLAITKTFANETSLTKTLVRPKSITFNLQYRIVNGSTVIQNWANIPNGKIDNVVDSQVKITPSNNQTDSLWTITLKNLPKKDGYGNEYQYQVTEAVMTYAGGSVNYNATGGTIGPFTVTQPGVSSLTNSKYTATVTNTLVTTTMSEIKTWNAEDNRDGLKVRTELYRTENSEVNSIVVATLQKSNNWQYQFTNLPLYKNLATAHDANNLSEYLLVETIPDGNTTQLTLVPSTAGTVDNTTGKARFVLNPSGSTEVKLNLLNTYTPETASIKATKNWQDNIAFNARPNSVTVRLQYQDPLNNNAWTDVPKATLDANGNYVVNGQPGDGHKAYTTSETVQTISLQSDNSWSTAAWENLRVNILNASGTPQKIVYRVVENSMDEYLYTITYSKNSTTLTKGTQTAIEVTNTLRTTDLKLSKTWDNKGQNASLVQPTTIVFHVQYRLGTGEWKDIPANWNIAGVVDSLVSVTSSNSWSKTLTGLPVQDVNGTPYTYRAYEATALYSADHTLDITGSFGENNKWTGAFNGYTCEVTNASATSNGLPHFTASAKNTIVLGSIEVDKVWDDENNRDGLRSELTITLKRKDGTAMTTVTTLKLNASNNYHNAFANLPVYTKYGVAYYTLTESGEHASYAVTYEADGIVASLLTETDNETGLDITNKRDIDTFSVTAKKIWADNSNYYNLRPLTVTMKLEWSTDRTNWSDSFDTETNGLGTNVFTSSDVSQTLTKPAAASDTWGTARWDDLPASVLVNGESKPVYYRVVETAGVDDSYSTAISDPVTYTRASAVPTEVQVKTADITNTLIPTKLEVEKIWDDVNNLYNTRPISLKVRLEYKLKTASSYAPLTDADGLFYELTLNDANGWKGSWENLPGGDVYDYRAVEISLTFAANGTTVVIPITNGRAANYEVSYTQPSATKTQITNKLPMTKLDVTKLWNDENNRDGVRLSAITFRLLLGETEIGNRITIQPKTDGSWPVAEWTQLPLFVFANGAPVTAIYTVEEVLTDGERELYTPVWNSKDFSFNLETLEIALEETNKHDIVLFEVDATKVWDDESDPYKMRPESVTLKLMWSTDKTNWSDVFDTATNGEGTNVFTTSPVSQILTPAPGVVSDRWGGANWKNLPAYVLVNGESTLVWYRVTETVGNNGSYKVIEADPVCFDENPTATKVLKDADVVNQPDGYTYLDVDKTWNDRENLYNSRPDSITVRLQYRLTGETEWADVPGTDAATLVLTAENGWRGRFENLLDQGVYEYRAVEIAMTYTVNGTTIVLPVENDKVGNYLVSYEQDDTEATSTDPKTYKTLITNTLPTTEVSVTKAWQDENNRDGVRLSSITYRLLLGNTEIGYRITIEPTEAGTWPNASWTQLPIYVFENGALTEAVYTVEEVLTTEEGELYTPVWTSKDFSFTEAQLNVVLNERNDHDIYLFTVEASKFWNDNTNRYGLRPLDVTLKLEWSTDKTNWSDSFDTATNGEGTNVFTTSAVSQKLTRPEGDAVNTWGPAVWENLPGYVLVNGESTKVWYRVVETSKLNDSYKTIISDPVCYEKDATTATVKKTADVTNSLDGYTFLDVVKEWDDRDNLYVSRPDSITVQLQYRLTGAGDDAWSVIPGAGVDTLQLTAENNWTVRFESLPDQGTYEYRAVELSMTYTVDGTEITFEVVDGQVVNYLVSYEQADTAATEELPATYKTIITNTLIDTKLSITKFWQDDINRDGIRLTEINFTLKKDGEPYGDVVTIHVGEDGSWPDAVWEQIPIYRITAEGVVECVYTVEETLTDEQGVLYYPEWLYKEFNFTEEEPEVSYDITNFHDIYLFSIRATKTWDDHDDPYGLRPGSVELKLQYKNDDGEWVDVSTEIPEVSDGTEVYTTSELEQVLERTYVEVKPEEPEESEESEGSTEPATEGEPAEGEPTEGEEPIEEPEPVYEAVWGYVTWEGLPAYRLTNGVSALVEYRVIETHPASTIYGTISSSETVTYDGAEEIESELTSTTEVENPVNGYIYLIVNKHWDNAAGKTLPESITVQLQYRDPASDEGWKVVPNGKREICPPQPETPEEPEEPVEGEPTEGEEPEEPVEEPVSNDWTYTYENLPEGYEYRVIEITINYPDKTVEVHDPDFAGEDEPIFIRKPVRIYAEGYTEPVYENMPEEPEEGETEEPILPTADPTLEPEEGEPAEGEEPIEEPDYGPVIGYITTLNNTIPPNTGDDNQLLLYSTMMVSAGAGLVYLMLKRRKKEEQ